MPAQVWSVSGLGGTLSVPVLSERLRFSAYGKMRFAQFVKVESNFGANKGDTLNFKKVGKVAQKGRIHAEGEPIQATTITFFPDTITIGELSNSIPFTDRVEELARLSIRSAIIQRLKDDAADAMDELYASAFQAADAVYTPTGQIQTPTFTEATNGSAGAQATRNLQSDDVKNIVDLMKSTHKAPAFDSEGRYVLIGSTQAMRGLKDSREIIDTQLHGYPERLIYGEVGEYYGCRMCEENNVLSTTLGLNANLGEAIVIGDDSVAEIIAKPLQLQAKVGEWERERGIRYVTWFGAKRTWSFTQDSQVRILHVSST